MPQPAALWPSPRNVLRQRLTVFRSKYYQALVATNLPTQWDERLSWPGHHNMLKVNTQQQSWWDSNPCHLSETLYYANKH